MDGTSVGNDEQEADEQGAHAELAGPHTHGEALLHYFGDARGVDDLFEAPQRQRGAQLSRRTTRRPRFVAGIEVGHHVTQAL